MKKIYLYTLAGAFTFLGAGCNKLKDFGDVNNNPAATVTPIPSALLSNVESNLGGYASNGTEAISGGQYAQYFTETQYSGTSLYNLPQNSFTGNYSGNLNNLQIVINQNPNKNMVNVAKILQQYIFWIVTDTWGDVPYSEALKGSANILPKYDTQESIYKGIITTLTEAINSFDSSPITGDIIYGGDVASWKRMANSLKLLVAVQMSNVTSASAVASAAASEAITSGVITTNDQNFKLQYPGGNYKSTWWTLYNGRKDFAESKTLTDVTGSTNDARQAAFGGESEVAGNVTTSNIGVPYGLARLNVTAFTDANPKWARILRGDLRLENGYVMLISAAETWLARAEAANLGWSSESISAAYKAGVTASFDQWGAGTPSNAYLNQFPVTDTKDASLTGSQVKNISTQRWISSYPDGHLGWNIWRKTGWPALTPAPDAVNSSKKIVRRFVYATSEYNTNGVNVNAAVARLSGGDSQDSHVWWDTRSN
ncbi:SusD/RagB family nutrient-binding outer membrane lipoprotein [Mucilaginibacter sp. SMC90]|uniref:SusD/RagB family nutrient-binding outer membrane lipoprotein n=1 Tax=Mucilaginibacter sp. SMC90 TaxID=2929803 RepID=UPI001FB2DC0D|nr:SusD/RagB family nutrient-binding outer membrane lipoprotein [Mucilaginibacter sp. SMC90]UOE51650.1 SusD/RagB family nutrient-binding outer membrane lipoprotein [Mucilaginibacter sp. SMC90]